MQRAWPSPRALSLLKCGAFKNLWKKEEQIFRGCKLKSFRMVRNVFLKLYTHYTVTPFSVSNIHVLTENTQLNWEITYMFPHVKLWGHRNTQICGTFVQSIVQHFSSSLFIGILRDVEHLYRALYVQHFTSSLFIGIHERLLRTETVRIA